MKNKLFLLAILAVLMFALASAQCPESFHDFSARDINGNNIDFTAFSGKKLLVVNTASQ
jgi:glutathione peroxidase